MSPPKTNRSVRTAIAIVLIAASGCVRGDKKRTIGNPQKTEERSWRELREDHFAAGILDQQELIARLRSEQADFGPDRHLIFDAVADCITMNRIGKTGDGGKWICNEYKIKEQSVVYGFGAGKDISFEEAMATRYGCEVHVFDPSPEAASRFGGLAKGKACGKGSVIFHAWGIGQEAAKAGEKSVNIVLDGEESPVSPLDEIIKRLKHSHVDVIKMDIEGDEWPVIADLLAKDLLGEKGVQQLLVEFHVGWNGSNFGRLIDTIDALAEAGYFLFRKELNPGGRNCCAEYAFAERGYILD